MNARSFAGAMFAAGLITAYATIFLSGCANPFRKQQTDQKKIAKQEEKIQKNEDAQVKQGAAFVYATGVALRQETNPSPAVAVAEDMNERAQVILGPPDYRDAVAMREMIEKLLSTNAAIKKAGAKMLAERDEAIGALQDENKILGNRLERLEEQRDENYVKAAVDATKWQKLVGWIRKILWGIGIAIGLLVGVNVAALAYPPLAPLAFLLNKLTGGIFGGIGAVIFRLIPTAKSTAGVVSKTEHEQVQHDVQLKDTTLTHLVSAIHELKEKDKEVYDKALRPKLLDKTSAETSRPVIEEIEAKVKARKKT